MNNRAVTLSLIFAFVAGFMVYSYLEGQESRLKEKYGNQIPVVVAKTDIKELDILDDRKVQIINIPKKYAAPGHFSKIEDIYNTIAATSILKGEQLTKTRITYPGAQSGLSRQIAIGKRAFSIQVSENQAVSKLVKPGDRVDVIFAIDYARGDKFKVKSKTVLQDVLVLSTGLSVTNSIPIVGLKADKEIRKLKLNNYTNYNSVTLELTPDQVQKVIYLLRIGSPPYLSLRNNDDKSIERVKSEGLFDVLDSDSGEAKQYYRDQIKK